MRYINVPISLTIFRMIMVPLFAIVFYLPEKWAPMVCVFIFFIAAITDWFDGFLARRWKQITDFGQFLDPMADKIMVVTALVLVSEYFHVWWVTFPTSSIIIREIIILILRIWMIRINYKKYISVSYLGKVKTFIQMFALSILLWRSEGWIVIIGIIFLYVSVFLTFWSMYYYLYIFFFDLLDH